MLICLLICLFVLIYYLRQFAFFCVICVPFFPINLHFLRHLRSFFPFFNSTPKSPKGDFWEVQILNDSANIERSFFLLPSSVSLPKSPL
jgi:hypothetical protein